MVVSDFIRMAQPTVTSEENTFQHKMKDLQQAPNIMWVVFQMGSFSTALSKRAPMGTLI